MAQAGEVDLLVSPCLRRLRDGQLEKLALKKLKLHTANIWDGIDQEAPLWNLAKSLWDLHLGTSPWRNLALSVDRMPRSSQSERDKYAEIAALLCSLCDAAQLPRWIIPDPRLFAYVLSRHVDAGKRTLRLTLTTHTRLSNALACPSLPRKQRWSGSLIRVGSNRKRTGLFSSDLDFHFVLNNGRVASQEVRQMMLEELQQLPFVRGPDGTPRPELGTLALKFSVVEKQRMVNVDVVVRPMEVLSDREDFPRLRCGAERSQNEEELLAFFKGSQPASFAVSFLKLVLHEDRPAGIVLEAFVKRVAGTCDVIHISLSGAILCLRALREFGDETGELMLDWKKDWEQLEESKPDSAEANKQAWETAAAAVRQGTLFTAFWDMHDLDFSKEGKHPFRHCFRKSDRHSMYKCLHCGDYNKGVDGGRCGLCGKIQTDHPNYAELHAEVSEFERTAIVSNEDNGEILALRPHSRR